jgi:hypothetical protein
LGRARDADETNRQQSCQKEGHGSLHVLAPLSKGACIGLCIILLYHKY